MENDRRIPLLVVMCVFPTLATAVVSVRIWMRAYVLRSFGYDDIFILIAWLIYAEYTISSAIALHYGVGSFIEQLTVYQHMKAFEATYFVELGYYSSVYFVKMSILAFYYRLPSSIRGTGKFWIANVVFMGILTAHFLSTIIVVIAQCRPISYFWDRDQIGSCIDVEVFYYSASIFNIITDVAIIILPIPILMETFKSKSTRLILLAVFLPGILSAMSSCIRLYTIEKFTQTHDSTYDAAPINLWSSVEISLGMICASGAAMKQVFLYFKHPDTGVGSMSDTELYTEFENKPKGCAASLEELSKC